MNDKTRPELAALEARLERSLDSHRREAREKRHAKGYRTARENLADLTDPDACGINRVGRAYDRRQRGTAKRIHG